MAGDDLDLRLVANYTTHPANVYPEDTPDRIDPATVTPWVTIEPATAPARANELVSPDRDELLGVPFVDVTVAPGALPEPQPGVFYLVPRAVAYLGAGRDDLVVPYRDVRDLEGRTIGFRGFARVTVPMWAGRPAGDAVHDPLTTLVELARTAAAVKPSALQRLGFNARHRTLFLVMQAQQVLAAMAHALQTAPVVECAGCMTGRVHQHVDVAGAAAIPPVTSSAPPPLPPPSGGRR